MLVGGASVNSLCQQGGPFALSVNRHTVIVYIKTRGRGRGGEEDLDFGMYLCIILQ